MVQDNNVTTNLSLAEVNALVACYRLLIQKARESKLRVSTKAAVSLTNETKFNDSLKEIINEAQ